MDERVRQLPRGRHGLAREEVVASQRGRLAVAVIDAVAEYGYSGTTVAHIVRGARVSRETFYEHFSSKDDCFLAAIGDGMAELVAVTQEALDGPGQAVDRIDVFLRVYLEWLSAHPTFARCVLLEVYSAGEPAMKLVESWVSALVRRFQELFPSGDVFACEFFIAGSRRLVAERLEAGRADELTALREPIMTTVRRYIAGAYTTAT
jgi:AcrR family transcriptional regulator